MSEVGTKEMNALQDHGIISDLCVNWDDVADSDKEIALKWLADRAKETGLCE